MWENYQNNEIQITRSIWKGHITEPKTRRSRGSIPVMAPLAKRLELHRVRSGNATAGVMFPNQNGSPMDLGNVLNRAILPALNRCAVCGKAKEECRRAALKTQDTTLNHNFERDKMLPEWHGWHAARRGLGTNLYRLGVAEKTIQAILRHANVSTTNTFYIKSAADDMRVRKERQLDPLLRRRERGALVLGLLFPARARIVEIGRSVHARQHAR